jgi:hypothetical protein
MHLVLGTNLLSIYGWRQSADAEHEGFSEVEGSRQIQSGVGAVIAGFEGGGKDAGLKAGTYRKEEERFVPKVGELFCT